MRSKRARSASGKRSSQAGSDSVPEPPGPPGFKKSVPMRRAGSAGKRQAVCGGPAVRGIDLVWFGDSSPPAWPLGRTRCVEVLRGGRSKVVLKYGYDELPGYGEFGDWRADELLAEVDAMIAAGTLESTGGRLPKLAVSEAEAA